VTTSRDRADMTHSRTEPDVAITRERAKAHRGRGAMRPRALVVSSKNASTSSEAAEAPIRHWRSGYPVAH
jgi:hypothetical protein